MAAEGGDGVQAFGIGNPAETARGDAGEAPADVVFAAEFAFFGDEQAEEGATHVPEADDGEVVRRNERSPYVRRNATASESGRYNSEKLVERG
jgi:hypothetical protein